MVKPTWQDLREAALKRYKNQVGEHAWFKYKTDSFDSCAKCGIVRRKDGLNKPCSGIVKLSLRSDK